jgi:hypothetical protein
MTHLDLEDRMWSGWPDPPEFCFFAMDNDTVWAVADFDRWPGTWTPPSVEPVPDQ